VGLSILFVRRCCALPGQLVTPRRIATSSCLCAHLPCCGVALLIVCLLDHCCCCRRAVSRGRVPPSTFVTRMWPPSGLALLLCLRGAFIGDFHSPVAIFGPWNPAQRVLLFAQLVRTVPIKSA